MNAVVRVGIALVLLAALLPAGAVAAQDGPADPTCAEVAAQIGARYESIWLGGSVTCVMFPPAERWNGDLVVFAHGYVDARQPVGIPWDQLIRDDTNLPALVTGLGYAFATTSYEKNGLAVRQGMADILELVDHARATNAIGRVYLTGASEGGLITALAVERHPDVFAAGLSTCGPIGSFSNQIQYWGDFRVAFDRLFPNVLLNPVGQPYGPSTPIYIDPLVVENWEAIAEGVVTPALASNPAAVQALLQQTGVPIDAADPAATAGESILGLLYYNVQATNDGRLTLNPAVTPDQLPPPSLAGNPYLNRAYVTAQYPGGLLRDPLAMAEIAAYYETTGRLNRPLVVMHTTGDPIIPFRQSLGYVQKATRAGKMMQVMLLPVNRYGHCAFTAPELVLGFYTMVLRATRTAFTPAQIQGALPDPTAQEAFDTLRRAR